MSRLTTLALMAGVALCISQAAMADEPAKGFLEGIHHHSTLTTTVTANGDLNPYALVVAPATVGQIQQGDVLIDNFNDVTNLQGTGTTILDYNPTTKATRLVVQLPKKMPQCPGGVGLTTAMTMLKSGWIIVGSTPSTDGTTRTKGQGCLIVLDANGKVNSVVASPTINGPWGNMAVIDHGDTATLFLSNAGYDVPGPDVKDPKTDFPVIIKKSTVIRIELAIPAGKAPQFKSQTVIASNLSARASRDSFLVGPTGLALGQDGKTLYVSDAVGNRIVAVDNATTRTDSAGEGREITKDGLMERPLAMATTPQGHLLVTNGINGEVVEIDPIAGKQLYAQWIDTDQAQSPPGNGDLFGIVMKPDGTGFYYVEDDMNTLMEAR